MLKNNYYTFTFPNAGFVAIFANSDLCVKEDLPSKYRHSVVYFKTLVFNGF